MSSYAGDLFHPHLKEKWDVLGTSRHQTHRGEDFLPTIVSLWYFGRSSLPRTGWKSCKRPSVFGATPWFLVSLQFAPLGPFGSCQNSWATRWEANWSISGRILAELTMYLCKLATILHSRMKSRPFVGANVIEGTSKSQSRDCTFENFWVSIVYYWSTTW